jgi:hypothetical protein
MFSTSWKEYYMVTTNEVIDLMKESPLWEKLSPDEQIGAIDYTLEVMRLKTENIEEIVDAFTN